MRGLTWRASGLAGLALVMSLGACQCEDKLREAVSRDEVKKYFDDTGSESESSEKEPNDVPEQATLLELNESLASTEAELSESGDRDWFSVRRDEEDTDLLTVRVEPTGEGFNPAIRLEADSADSEPVTYDSAGAGETEVVRNLDLSDRVRRIGILSTDGSAGTYELRFERRLTEGSVEREPNNSRETATSFEFPGAIEGTYGRAEDEDWFHVLAEDATPGAYQLDIKPTGSSAQTIEMYVDRRGDEPYWSASVPAEEPLEFPNIRVPEEVDGLWFRLEADGQVEAEASYRLRIVEHPRTPDRRLETEPNGEKSHSVGLNLGGRSAGYIDPEDDLDLYHLAVGRPLPETSVDAGPPPEPDVGGAEPEEEDVGAGPRDVGTRDERSMLSRLPRKRRPPYTLRIRLTPNSKSKTFTLVRWRGGWDGEKIERTTDEPGESVEICSLGTGRGLLRLGVRAETVEAEERVRRGFDYELVTEDVSSEYPALEVEANDSRGRADRLRFGARRSAFIATSDDRDVFGFAVTADGDGEEADDSDAGSGENSPGPTRHPVQLEVRGNALDLAFKVLDRRGGLVAEVDRNGPGGDETTDLDLPPGVYYVKVRSDTGASCKPYRVAVERLRDEPEDAGETGPDPEDEG